MIRVEHGTVQDFILITQINSGVPYRYYMSIYIPYCRSKTTLRKPRTDALPNTNPNDSYRISLF